MTFLSEMPGTTAQRRMGRALEVLTALTRLISIAISEYRPADGIARCRCKKDLGTSTLAALR
jgi:hypothetical protein